MHGFAHGHRAAGDQSGHVGVEFLHAVEELVGVNEAFHADSRRNGADQIVHLLGMAVIVDVDHAADGEAGEIIGRREGGRSEEHTSELQSLMRISYAVFCLKKKKKRHKYKKNT